jgi:hypothetical protein
MSDFIHPSLQGASGYLEQDTVDLSDAYMSVVAASGIYAMAIHIALDDGEFTALNKIAAALDISPLPLETENSLG